MSFAAQTKKELTFIHDAQCCRRTEMSAILSLNGWLGQAEDGRYYLEVQTENVATARRIYTELKEQFVVHPEVLVRKKMRLKKNNVYAVRVSETQLDTVFQGLEWDRPEHAGSLAGVSVKALASHRQRKCCRRAYLRGAFLAAGSVNDPASSSYHLELSMATHDQASYLLGVMNTYGLHAKLINRKKGFVVYLKEGEKIVEFLNVIGAHQALLKFEDKRIIKGMRNQVNRLVNCETANLNKTISAAIRQVEVIRFIDNHMGLDKLPPHLREVAQLRLSYPEVNLQELATRLGGSVTKSGLNHRFRKLEEIASNLRS